MGKGIEKLQALDVCEKLTGERPDDVTYPGGRSRESVRLHFGDRTRILTRRPDSDKARREARILRALHENGGPVPEIFAFDGLWMVQEDLGNRRLSFVLNGDDRDERGRAMEAAVVGLANCHDASRAAEPLKSAHLLGFKRDWIEKLIGNPRQIGKKIGVNAPKLDMDTLVPFLRVRTASVVKWDSRPGNAAIRDDGACAWFDWEHCGRRNPPDDLAWLLGDEFMPDEPEIEAQVLTDHIGRFSRGFDSTEETLLYLLAFGVFHMTVRLELIVYRRLRDGEWWDFDYCMKGDKIGVAAICVERLCKRGARWAMANSATAPLSAWFLDVLAFIEQKDADAVAAE
jgi:aminoglycoside phosphotransferase (APT) family kinase protein